MQHLTPQPETSETRGDFALVLHTHMPFLKLAGNWPVGEEWLFQAWGEAYLPVIDVLRERADARRRGMLTIGLTPLVLEQMRDPGLLERFHIWIGQGLLRCEMLAANAQLYENTAERREAAVFWWRHYKAMLDSFEAKGCELVPAFRDLLAKGAVEVLGGPLTHAYLPLHDTDTVRAQLRLGLDRGEELLGERPRGIWLPECAYRPGLEDILSECGVEYTILDGPSLLRATEDFSALRRGWRLGDSDTAAFGRDLEVTYRVWSPTGGYPGNGAYREYHRWEFETGLKLWRVTDKSVPQDDKELYDPALVGDVVAAQVDDFARLVRESFARDGDIVVACYDTELFGHWWLEGPQWLGLLLDRLGADPDVALTTIAGAVAGGDVSAEVTPPASSWGLRKDFSIWENEDTAQIWSRLDELNRRLHKTLDAHDQAKRTIRAAPGTGSAAPSIRDRLLVQGLRELALAQGSDWPFMIGHDKSVEYAQERFDVHADATAFCFDMHEAVGARGPDALTAEDASHLDWLERTHDIAPGLDVAAVQRSYGREVSE